MAESDKKPDFTRIGLKYKTIEAFSKVAKTTFNKGRMTLKSKKEFKEGERIVLAVKFLDTPETIDIISEVIQSVGADKTGEANTYGVRWLNFTDKKLSKFLEKSAASKEKPAPGDPATTKPEAPEAPPPPPAPVKPVKKKKAAPAKTPPPPAPSAPESPAPGKETPSAPAAEPEPEKTTHPQNAPEVKSVKPIPPPPLSEPTSWPATVEEEPLEAPPQSAADPETSSEPLQINLEDDSSFDLPPDTNSSPKAKAEKTPAIETEPELEPPTAPEPVLAADEEILEPEEAESAQELEDADLEPPAAETPVEQEPAPPPPEPPEPPPTAPTAPVEELKAPEPLAAAPRRFSESELSEIGGFLAKFARLVMAPEKLKTAEAENLVKPLFRDFKEMLSARSEIQLYIRSQGAAREFMLAGESAEPVNLKTALSAEAFGELAMKLVELFDKKGLAGLQFRKFLREKSLLSLVRILGDYSPPGRSAEELAADLIREGVFHFTPIHEADRVSGSGELDFRVDMTLSRLRGELKQLKFLAEAMSEDPAAVLTLRMEDALKALPNGVLRAELLLHFDLMASGQEEFTVSDLALEAVMATPADLLAEAGDHLARSYEDLFSRIESGAEGEAAQARLEKVRFALRRVTARLLVELPEVAARIMGDLYRRGVFTLGELPPELRERMMLDQFINFFLEDPGQRLADFSAIKTARDYQVASNRYVLMVAELMRRGEVEVADKIFRTLIEHLKTPEPSLPDRGSMAREAMKQLARPGLIKILLDTVVKVDKERREKVAAVIYAAGAPASVAIIEAMAEIEDRSLRRILCEILARIGTPAVSPIVDRINRPESPWFLIRNLLMILGDMKNPAVLHNLDSFLRHEHPRVREEALVYAVKLQGVESEQKISGSLSDPDPVVQRRAVRLLSRFPELSPAALEAAAQYLERKLDGEVAAEDEPAVVSAAETLGKFKPAGLPGGGTVEDILIPILEAETGRGGFLGRLTGTKTRHSAKLRGAIIEALGKVGTGKAQKVLAALAKDKDPQVKEKALAALGELEKR